MMPFLVSLDCTSLTQDKDPDFDKSWLVKLPYTAQSQRNKPSTQVSSCRQQTLKCGNEHSWQMAIIENSKVK